MLFRVVLLSLPLVFGVACGGKKKKKSSKKTPKVTEQTKTDDSQMRTVEQKYKDLFTSSQELQQSVQVERNSLNEVNGKFTAFANAVSAHFDLYDSTCKTRSSVSNQVIDSRNKVEQEKIALDQMITRYDAESKAVVEKLMSNTDEVYTDANQRQNAKTELNTLYENRSQSISGLNRLANENMELINQRYANCRGTAYVNNGSNQSQTQATQQTQTATQSTQTTIKTNNANLDCQADWKVISSTRDKLVCQFSESGKCYYLSRGLFRAWWVPATCPR